LVAVKRVYSILSQLSQFEQFLLKSDRIKLLLVQELKNLREFIISFDKRSFFSSKMRGHLKLWDLSYIKDLCVQSLIKLVIEPVLEVTADIHNFGFRQNRSAHQALALLYKQFKSSVGSEDFGILIGGSSEKINSSNFAWIKNNLPIPSQYIFLLKN
jgi:retron-type reverse transcriptase